MPCLPLDTLRGMLQTVASQGDLLASVAPTPTLDRLVDGVNQYVGATFLPGVFGPGTEEEANTAPTHLLRDLLRRLPLALTSFTPSLRPPRVTPPLPPPRPDRALFS